jgi:phage terminase large subunit
MLMATRDPNWPLDYMQIAKERTLTLMRCREDKEIAKAAARAYSLNPVAFIEECVNTFDPRNAATNKLTRMPFVLFERQRNLIQFFEQCILTESHGLVEKSRDMGATWCACAFSVWLWVFKPGASVGWGSRKEQLVDRLGDIDSIFEKIRQIVDGLPDEFRPVKFQSAHMKLINEDNGASITGESGDEIGRGGRKLVYFVDEAAHLEHPEATDAALRDNTRVQIDISSVNGIGNVFYRRRESGDDWYPNAKITPGRTQVFVLDWRDHPDKTQAWYEARKRKAIDEGLLHKFKQEIDRDYAAALSGTILQREWIISAIDAHKKIPGMFSGRYVAALDVADGGGDTNALVRRKGSILEHAEEWGERDTGVTARRCLDAVKMFLPCDVMYDSVGVGSGVKAETNRLKDEKLIPAKVRFFSWDAGSTAFPPDENVIKGDRSSPLNKDHYANLKAQGWWELRKRFERTHRAITEGVKYKPEDLISLSSELPLLRKIEKELLQPTSSLTSNMRLVVDKTPEGARSPNLGDAVMMCFHPAPTIGSFDATLSWVQ